MVNRGLNIIIGFGTIVAIGITIAIYKIMTMPSMVNTFLAITITIAVAICLGIAAGISFLIIHINHRRRLYRIDTDAKEIALDALRTRQYATSEQFDIEYARHIRDVLHGHVIETKQPKAIEKPRHMISNMIPRVSDTTNNNHE